MKAVRSPSACRKIESFAEKMFAKRATLITPLIIGGFNVLYPIRVEGLSTMVLIRLLCPVQAVFPEEKTLAEVATAACIRQCTAVPTPKIFGHGIDPEIGPFMVIQDLGSRRGMGQALEAPREDPKQTPILRPDISEENLKKIYARMACRGSYHVMERPFTMNMSNMVQLSNIPKSIFPAKGTTYQTADEWYTVLAEMHIATLVFQHNDMVSSEDDCRTKYVARQIFLRLAKQGKLSNSGFIEDKWSACSKSPGATLPAPDKPGSFRIWSDDLRPANILVDEDDHILGAIDWEFAYVGPTQFTLIRLGGCYLMRRRCGRMASITGLAYTRDGCRPGFQPWKRQNKKWAPALLLSAYMRESWATGRFWLNYCARKSWAFDAVYWKYLDERFFGRREGNLPAEELWKTRVHFLSEEERAAMESLVQIKMEESMDRVLIEWDAADARRRLSSFIFN